MIAAMRYRREEGWPFDKWKPVPIYERIAQAGWGLILPPTLWAMGGSLIYGVFWVIGQFTTYFSGREKSWDFGSWSTWLVIVSQVWLVATWELAVINGDTVCLDDMVILRMERMEQVVKEPGINPDVKRLAELNRLVWWE